MQMNNLNIPQARCEGIYIGGDINYADMIANNDLSALSIDLVLKGEHYWVQFIPEFSGDDGHYPAITNTSLSKLVDDDFSLMSILRKMYYALEQAHERPTRSMTPIDRDLSKWTIIKMTDSKINAIIVDGNNRPIVGFGRYPEVGVEWCIFGTINEVEMHHILNLKRNI